MARGRTMRRVGHKIMSGQQWMLKFHFVGSATLLAPVFAPPGPRALRLVPST